MRFIPVVKGIHVLNFQSALPILTTAKHKSRKKLLQTNGGIEKERKLKKPQGSLKFRFPGGHCFWIVTILTGSRNKIHPVFAVVDFSAKLFVTLARCLAAAVSMFCAFIAQFGRRREIFPLLMLCLAGGGWDDARAQIPPHLGMIATNEADAKSNELPHFVVREYVVEDHGLMPTNIWAPILSKYTGPNVSLGEIVKGASELQAAYRSRGHPLTSIAIAQQEIANGVVTLNVFQTAIPQVVVSGVRYYCPTVGEVSNLPAIAPVLVSETTAPPATNTAETASPALFPPAAASTSGGWPVPPPASTPAQIARARAALLREYAEMEAKENDTRIHVVSTNAGPRFEVEKYRITGNTILSPQTMARILTSIDGDYGTNVSIEGIRTVVEQLQQAYRERGYVTVAVGLPQQRLTNATVKVQVTEGRLATIDVEGNHYFSSNNVMRALPSLHTNLLLNANILQAELNRANANQDRQIYPVISPGPEPGASALALHVKDQLPLHAKLQLNNQNSPGTPDLRVNGSAVYDNLWQREHELGVQYGFSPEDYKLGDHWNFYDEPSVADYSAFYRLPLGGPASLENTVENHPAFGYNEATHQFNLPPPTGQTELTMYASRATIDTGVEPISSVVEFNDPQRRVITLDEDQEGLTINEDMGFQLSKPLPEFDGIFSTLAGGLDYKIYSQDNDQTNTFVFNEYTKNASGRSVERTTYINNPTLTKEWVDYFPLELSYNASVNNFLGPATFGLAMSANLWFLSSTRSIQPNNTSTNSPPVYYGRKSLDSITGSGESTGYWVILRPSFSQSIVSANNWTTTLRMDGQWSSEPLISSEQFGIGGVNSVRGYHEGEIFGDTGWHASLEEETPPHVVGAVYGGQLLTVRGSLYTDGATAYLLDPQGRSPVSKLWSLGLGLDTSVGSHWQAQFLFSFPMIDTVLVDRYQPYFNFALTAQF